VKKRDLAKHLIKRQIEGGYYRGVYNRESLRNVKDDEMIDNYVRCSRCMALIASSDVSVYKTADEFIEAIEDALKKHVCGSTTLSH